MAFLGAEDFKEQVRRAIDIVDLVGGYAPLRRAGRVYVTHCPWHDDSRPSLQVNQERQSWKCWVCQIGGDVFNFVMRKEGIGFREALVMLAEKAGIPVPQFGTPAKPGSPDDKQALFAALKWAEQQYHTCLLNAPEAEPARKYLRDRGIDSASIARYQLGFAPDQWQWLGDRARGTPHSIEILETIGLLGRSQSSNRPYDRFKGRVLFSIRDTQSRCIAFGGRILPGNTDERAAKYINSPETRLFSKSENLYGLDVARDAVSKSRHVLVMEGYTDVVIARQCGVENVVAVLGTALGAKHVKLLKRFADTVTLVLDGDEAGRKRTNEILDLFVAEQIDLRVLTLPNELDPADFLLERGAGDFNGLLGGAIDALEHKVRVAMTGIDPGRDLHRAHAALEDILSTLAKAPVNDVSASSALQLRQQQMVAKLSRQFRIAESDIRTRLADLRQQAKSNASTQAGPDGSPSNTPRPVLRLSPVSALDPWERELLEVLVVHPEAAPALLEAIGQGELTSDSARLLCGVYRTLNDAGIDLEFGRVLGTIEDPALSAFLVAVDESAHSRDTVDPDTRVKEVLNQFAKRREEREMRQRLADLKSPAAKNSDELALELLMEEQRRRRLEIEQARQK